MDNCDNSDSISQTISINDGTSPVLDSAPADIPGECAFNVPTPVSLAFTDNCDGAGTVHSTDKMTPGSCSNKVSHCS